MNFDWYVTDFCFKGTNLQYFIIGSDNFLFLGRCQAIISTNDGQFSDAYMRHSASIRYALSVDYSCVCLLPCEWLIVVHLIKSCRTSSHNIWRFRSHQFILPFNIKINFWLNIRNIIFVVCVAKIGMHDLYRKGSINSSSTLSMVWLLMTWFLVSLGQQQP